MATNRAMFSDLYAPGLRKRIFETYTGLPTEYDKVLNVGNLDGQYVEDYRMGGFGAVQEKPEGTSILYDDPVAGGKVRYIVTPFGKGFRVTYEAQRDERYGQMKKMATSLGRAFRNKTEIIGAAPFNVAFASGTTLSPATGIGYGGFDGLCLCHASHTLLRGGTYSNRLSADFSPSALQDGLLLFEKCVDESSVPVVIKPKYVACPPDVAPYVRETLGSQFKPYTADNEINVLQQAGLGIIVLHYLTDTTAWFLLADKSEHDLQFFWRDKFVTDSADDFDSGDGKMKGYMRAGASFGDWRGVVGSNV